MIPYTPLDAFTQTDIYDLSDLVLGGATGVSNEPIKALLDQTNYLLKRMGASFEDVKVLTGSYSWVVADIRKLFVFTLTDNATFTLPDVTTLRKGAIVAIATRYSAVKALTVRGTGGQLILDGMDALTEQYMHDAERLWLMAAGTYWEVAIAQGNFYTAGESFGGRKQMKNTAVLNGSIITRADMPRIAKFANSLPNGQAIVSDAQWLSDPSGLPFYRGCFSYGNGTTTLRLPDERGMFDRYLDLGRGLDTGRFHPYEGGFEQMELQAHSHTSSPDDKPGKSDNANDRDVMVPGGNGRNIQTGSTGGSETRPKNIGKIPLIRY